ncbi:MAG: AarF/UbiB family protein [Desulfobacterales bacterium]
MRIKAIANLNRFKDIVFILIKYGFGSMVEHLDFPGKHEKLKASYPDKRLGTYERFRMALEDLGPTFIKFGQIMSLRSDLLPKELVLELRKLQDEVPPVDFPSIRQVIEENIKHPLEEMFILFEEKPIAAASLSQVHRAVIKESRQAVAVKVQRPNIQNKIETDLNILETIADQIHERLTEYKIYDFPSLVRLTRRNIHRELNFIREARYMAIARSRMEEMEGIYIPIAFTELSTPQMLVMELIEGKKLKEFDVKKLQNPEPLARRGLKLTIKQILEDGFFHADPHPGNLLITEDQVMCILDWGMVGRLTEGERFDLIEFLFAIVDMDSKRLVDALLVIANAEEETDRRRLERDLLDILDSYLSIPLKELNLGSLILEITDLLREYRLRLPPDLFIMLKALVTAEGTARLIYPDLDVISQAEPFVRKVASKRYKPGLLLKKLKTTFSRILTYRGNIGRRFIQIVEKIDRGELNIRFEHKNLGGLRNTLENISSRLTIGIIIAAMIIGSSMIITTGVRPFLFGFPAIGMIGYIISAIAGLWLIYNIIKSRRY